MWLCYKEYKAWENDGMNETAELWWFGGSIDQLPPPLLRNITSVEVWASFCCLGTWLAWGVNFSVNYTFVFLISPLKHSPSLTNSYKGSHAASRLFLFSISLSYSSWFLHVFFLANGKGVFLWICSNLEDEFHMISCSIGIGRLRFSLWY